MKRVAISFLLLAAMLTGMMNVWAAEAEISVQVCASKMEVQVGDTVEYTVLATGSGVTAMQFELRLPEGLRYVPNSGATPENLAQKLGVPAADWTEQSMMFTFYNDIGITFDEDTEILRFSCVAEQAGEWAVELYELLPFNGAFEEFTPKLQVQKVRVTGEAPQETPTVPEETLPSQTPETKPPVSTPEETVTSPDPDNTLVTTPSVSAPDPTENQTAVDTLTEPVEQPEDDLSTDTAQNAQPEKKAADYTLRWVLLAAGVAVIAVGAVVFVLLKKKRV